MGREVASLDRFGRTTFAKYHRVPYTALLVLIYSGSETTKPSLLLDGHHQAGASAAVSVFSQHWTLLKLLSWTCTCVLPIEEKGTKWGKPNQPPWGAMPSDNELTCNG